MFPQKGTLVHPYSVVVESHSWNKVSSNINLVITIIMMNTVLVLARSTTRSKTVFFKYLFYLRISHNQEQNSDSHHWEATVQTLHYHLPVKCRECVRCWDAKASQGHACSIQDLWKQDNLWLLPTRDQLRFCSALGITSASLQNAVTVHWLFCNKF